MISECYNNYHKRKNRYMYSVVNQSFVEQIIVTKKQTTCITFLVIKTLFIVKGGTAVFYPSLSG